MANLVTVDYQPLRVGFLVKEGSIADLIAAARLSVMTYGGMFNPIIPVGDERAGVGDYLLSRYQVDALCPISPGLETTKFRAKYPHIRFEHRLDDELFFVDPRSKKRVCVLLDVCSAIERVWRDELRHKTADFKSKARLVKWDDGDKLAGLFSAVFGRYPAREDGYSEDYQRLFLEGLRASEVTLNEGAPIPGDLGEAITPMNASGLSIWRAGGVKEAGIYLGRVDSFRDLLAFWNLRANGATVVFHAIDHAERTMPMAEAFAKRVAETPPEHPEFARMVSFYHLMSNDEAAGERQFPSHPG